MLRQVLHALRASISKFKSIKVWPFTGEEAKAQRGW